MQGTLYMNSSAQNVVHKSLTSIATVDIELTNNFNLTGGDIRMRRNDNYLGCNYFYIPQFRRYYFCEISVENGAFMIATLKSDALSSFWDEYKNSQCLAHRSTSHPDIRIPDERIMVMDRPNVVVRRLGAAFEYSSSNNYVLTISGQ